MRADLVTLKRFGFNAIRAAHYPNDPTLLDLADELGFYVVDEANIEAHDHAHEIADDPATSAPSWTASPVRSCATRTTPR